jgi:hypothetical protein
LDEHGSRTKNPNPYERGWSAFGATIRRIRGLIGDCADAMQRKGRAQLQAEKPSVSAVRRRASYIKPQAVVRSPLPLLHLVSSHGRAVVALALGLFRSNVFVSVGCVMETPPMLFFLD